MPYRSLCINAGVLGGRYFTAFTTAVAAENERFGASYSRRSLCIERLNVIEKIALHTASI